MADDAPQRSRKRQKTTLPAPEAGVDPLRLDKFSRGAKVGTRRIEDKKLKAQLQYGERLASEATVAAARADEWLLPHGAGGIEVEGMERTYQLSQAALAAAGEVGTSRKALDLDFPQLGPYCLDWTRNGRYMVLGGRKGHLALMAWQQAQPFAELQVRETVRDVVMLHNESFFAAAQKKHVYIYDKHGLEVHCLREHTSPRRLEFLPYHFLLASVGQPGVLHYQDTTTGQMVAQHRTRQGPCNVLRQNPWNGVMLTGHANGTVQMWTPNLPQAAVKMLCHQGPLTAVAVDATGQHLVTAGIDSQVKVWDVRTFRPLHSFKATAPVTCLDISQRGLLATGQGRRVQVYQDALDRPVKAPYLTHIVQRGAVNQLRFCPYEDVLGVWHAGGISTLLIPGAGRPGRGACRGRVYPAQDVLGVGHAGGVSTLLIPGAGEPNYDSRVADPFQGRKARREQEVHRLLDKLQPDMIVLNPDGIGQVKREPEEARQEKLAAAARANAEAKAAQQAKNDAKTPMKGKNRPSRRFRKRQSNIIEETKEKIRKGQGAEKPQQPPVVIPESAPKLLHRFYKGKSA